MYLSYGQAFHFFIFTQENESACLHRDLYVNVAISFVNVPNWNQFKLSITSRSEWINRWQYILTVEHYSSLKRNKLLVHATAWMDFKVIKLSKRSQTKGYIHVILFM